MENHCAGAIQQNTTRGYVGFSPIITYFVYALGSCGMSNFLQLPNSLQNLIFFSRAQVSSINTSQAYERIWYAKEKNKPMLTPAGF